MITKNSELIEQTVANYFMKDIHSFHLSSLHNRVFFKVTKDVVILFSIKNSLVVEEIREKGRQKSC